MSRHAAGADSFGGLPLNQILRADADINPLLDVISGQDPERLKITSRVRVLQGDADRTVFPDFTTQLVEDYRERGTKVAYTVYPGVGHAAVVDAGGADATSWIERRVK